MKTTYLILPLAMLVIGCHKKPDAPAPSAVTAPPSDSPEPTPTTPTPPPVTSCKGATVLYSLPSGELINDNSSRSFTITGFEVSCGDTVRVFMRRPNIQGEPWTEYFNIDNGASYFAINDQVITVYNKTGIVLEVAIEAVLK